MGNGLPPQRSRRPRGSAIRIQNEALLLKNLHKFFNKENIPWVQLIWEKYYKNGKLPNHTMKDSFW
jgi:hypothetical protein